MELPVLIGLAVVVLILIGLRVVDTQPIRNAGADSKRQADVNIITCKSDDDIRRFTGRPVSPPNDKLIRRFEEMDDAEMRRYCRSNYAAD